MQLGRAVGAPLLRAAAAAPAPPLRPQRAGAVPAAGTEARVVRRVDEMLFAPPEQRNTQEWEFERYKMAMDVPMARSATATRTAAAGACLAAGAAASVALAAG